MQRCPPLFWLLALLPLAGCHGIGTIAEDAVVGTGPIKTESRKIDSFSKIKIQQALQADVEVGGKLSVSVEAHENLLPLITVKVDGNDLVLESAKPIDSSTPVKVHIVVPSLFAVDASGASTVVATSVKSARFSVDASGASSVDLSGDFGSLSATAEGASTVKFNGTATDGKLEADGASKIEATSLKMGNAVAEASGASTVRIGPSKSIDAKAGGASTISYQGKPNIVRSDSSGASSIDASG